MRPLPTADRLLTDTLTVIMRLIRITRRPWRAAGAIAACAAAAAAAGWWTLPWAVDLPPGLVGDLPTSPRVYDRHGEEIASLPDASWLRARPAEPGDLPADLVAATIAAEDKRFFSHGGVDLLATARAARDALVQRRFVSGASTITQQLVKVSAPPARRNLRTKGYEILAARQLEMRWPKEAILARYLNSVEYGNGRRGAAEAAGFYFDKPLSDLSLGECALLAGLPQAPSRLNPVRHPDRAAARRDTVLDRLLRSGADRERVRAARDEPVDAAAHLAAPPPHHLVESVRELAFRAGRADTTIDLALQRDTEAIVADVLAGLEGTGAEHAAVVVIDNATGGVLALVGSAGTDRPGGHLNGALLPRSAGSTLKPFTYLLAFETLGSFPGSILPDIPTRWKTPEGLGLPANYDGTYRGPVSVREALACSLNIPAMRQLETLGGPGPLATSLRRFGIGTPEGRGVTDLGLGLTIGNLEVSLLDLTGAYAALARGGLYLPPALLAGTTPEPVRAASPECVWMIADILSDNAARAASFGPNSPLVLPFRCAAKTGTSSDFRDNWCVGFTAEITVGVWVGNFDARPMASVTGVSGSGPVFHRVMQRACRATTPTWPLRPSGLQRVAIDSRTGHQLATADTGGSPHTTTEWCQSSHLPVFADPGRDYDGSGRALLDDRYRDWFANHGHLRRDRFALGGGHPEGLAPSILQPLDSATYLLDPELPSGGRSIELVTNLPGPVEWDCPTLRNNGGILYLAPGRHTVQLTDPATGATTHATFDVESL